MSLKLFNANINRSFQELRLYVKYIQKIMRDRLSSSENSLENTAYKMALLNKATNLPVYLGRHEKGQRRVCQMSSRVYLIVRFSRIPRLY